MKRAFLIAPSPAEAPAGGWTSWGNECCWQWKRGDFTHRREGHSRPCVRQQHSPLDPGTSASLLQVRENGGAIGQANWHGHLRQRLRRSGQLARWGEDDSTVAGTFFICPQRLRKEP